MKSLPLAVLACSALSACAGLLPPSPAETATLPVIAYGNPAPAGQPFILHYPAGSALPVLASVSGSLLEREDKAELHVSLKRDVYLYQSWASFDGKNWQRGHDLVSGKFTISLPGEADGRSPGTLAAEFNSK